MGTLIATYAAAAAMVSIYTTLLTVGTSRVLRRLNRLETLRRSKAAEFVPTKKVA